MKMGSKPKKVKMPDHILEALYKDRAVRFRNVQPLIDAYLDDMTGMVAADPEYVKEIVDLYCGGVAGKDVDALLLARNDATEEDVEICKHAHMNAWAVANCEKKRADELQNRLDKYVMDEERRTAERNEIMARVPDLDDLVSDIDLRSEMDAAEAGFLFCYACAIVEEYALGVYGMPDKEELRRIAAGVYLYHIKSKDRRMCVDVVPYQRRLGFVLDGRVLSKEEQDLIANPIGSVRAALHMRP